MTEPASFSQMGKKGQKGREIGVYFDNELLAQLDSYAEAQRHSRSWLICELVRKAMGDMRESPGDPMYTPPDNQQGERH